MAQRNGNRVMLNPKKPSLIPGYDRYSLRLIINAVRSNSITTTPCWLRPVCLKRTTPRSGWNATRAFQHLGFDVKGVAVEEGMRVLDALVAQVGDQGALGQVRHGEADGQTQGEDAVDDTLPELRLAGDSPR